MINKVWYFILMGFFLGFVLFAEAHASVLNSQTASARQLASEKSFHPAKIDWQQNLVDLKDGFQASWPYKILSFVFNFEALDKGSGEIVDAFVNHYYGGAPLDGPELRRGLGRVGVFAIGLVPMTKLVGALYKGFSLMAVTKILPALAEGGVLRLGERLMLQKQLMRLGESALSTSVMSTVRLESVEALVETQAMSYFKTVGTWTSLIAAPRLVGFALPAYPASLRPADVAIFALNQGCLLAAESNLNPTTRLLKVSGGAVKGALDWINDSRSDSLMSRADLLKRAYEHPQCRPDGIESVMPKAYSEDISYEKLLVSQAVLPQGI